MEAERFLEAFRERLAKFGLELHPEKTRLIEFGRFTAQDRERRGEGKPETILRRRSQRPASWNRVTRIFPRWIPASRVLHPYPIARFLATHPRWEPYA
jgi:hypothetical protein